LPGGWGIMADDWLAAVYAALGLWLLRWLGL
jgi:phosphatidylglycerophosphatase A